jgi:hypothetical protein
MVPEQSQSEKFKQAARELECDESEERWDDQLRKVAKSKPEPEKLK